MSRTYIPFLAFLVLIILTIPFSFDFAISVTPGWHTTVYPSYFIGGLISMVVLPFITIGYWLRLKQVDKVTWALFAFHFILTIPTTIYLIFPSILLGVQVTNQDEIIKAVAFRIKLIPVAKTFFIVGQVFFLVYYIRTIRASCTAT